MQKRFADFVADAASKAAEAAQAALDADVVALKGIVIPKTRDVENALADYRKLDAASEKIAADVIGYFAAAEARRTALLGGSPVRRLSEDRGAARSRRQAA